MAILNGCASSEEPPAPLPERVVEGASVDPRVLLLDLGSGSDGKLAVASMEGVGPVVTVRGGIGSVAVDGEGWLVASGSALTRYDWSGVPGRSWAPGAMEVVLVHGDLAYAGVGDQLHHTGSSAPLKAHVRRNAEGVTYGVMDRNAHWIVAVDQGAPKLGVDLFDTRGGRSTRIAYWTLPGPTAGSCVDAAVVLPDLESSDGTLFLVASGGSDQGSSLIRVPFLQGVVDDSEIVEHFEFAGQPPWTALAVLPNATAPTHVAVAAGERGILLFPAGFERDAEPVVTGGRVWDLARVGEALFVLAGADSRVLIRYALESGALVETGRVEVPGEWTAIARR